MSSSQQQFNVYYDGCNWQAFDAEQNMLTLSVADDETLPTLPEHAVASSLLLPIEQLLARTFTLPFSHTKFIDQDILAQELEEHTAEDSDAWWLSWQAGNTDDGVAGFMLGLPESMRQYMDNHEAWQHTRHINADICLRLNAQRQQQFQAFPQLQESTEPIAIFDTDRNGLFFAVWQPSSDAQSTGFWLAMRRLNWSDSKPLQTSTIENITRSLHSIGWHDEQLSTGSLYPELHAALNLSHWSGSLIDDDQLPSRHDANIAASLTLNSVSKMKGQDNTSFNFRHGRWRSESRLTQIKPWYRSIALAISLMFIWSAGMMWQNHQLQQQISTNQQHVIVAFHRGLPDQTVIIDALAQLRKAAGGNKSPSATNQIQAKQWLQDIQAINTVYQKTPWQMKSLSFQHGKMNLHGQTLDLQSMNHIRQALQHELGRDVKLLDTDLSNQHVSFKLVWS